MKRYEVIITCVSGATLKARVVARNQHDAIRRIEHTTEAENFLRGEVLKGFDVKPIAEKHIDNARFGVTNVLNKPGWYVVADLDNRVKIEFKKGHFNDIQRVLPIDKSWHFLDPLDQATALREIGEYMQAYFPDII